MCVNLTYVGKLAENNKGKNFSLNRQDLFDVTVDANGKNLKVSKETAGAFLKMTAKNKPGRDLGRKGI